MWKLKQWLPGSNGRQEDTIVKDWWLLRAINSCLITALSNDFEGLWSFLLSYCEILEPELWCGWSARPTPRCLAAVASCTSCQRGKIERSCLTRGSHVAVKSHLFTCTNGLIPLFYFGQGNREQTVLNVSELKTARRRTSSSGRHETGIS